MGFLFDLFLSRFILLVMCHSGSVHHIAENNNSSWNLIVSDTVEFSYVDWYLGLAVSVILSFD